jgi:hypothetical protein
MYYSYIEIEYIATSYSPARTNLSVKLLRTFGEAGIKGRKVGDRGITMMFVGYAQEHAGNCYRMYNPVTSGVSETHDIILMGRMYFTSENCENAEVLPVIAVPITNDVSNKDLAVTEVIKVTLTNSMGGEGIDTVAETPNSSSKEGWVAVTTKKGRKSIPMKCYDPDPASGKTVKWNVTAIDVDLDIGTVSQNGYYKIFNVVDQDEIILTLLHHNLSFEVANIGAGVAASL